MTAWTDYFVYVVLFVIGVMLGAFLVYLWRFAGDVSSFIRGRRAGRVSISAGDYRRLGDIVDKMTAVERLMVLRHVLRADYHARVSVSASGVVIDAVSVSDFLEGDDLQDAG